MSYSPRHAIARLSAATKLAIVTVAAGGLLSAGTVAAIGVSAATVAPKCAGAAASGPFSEHVTDSAGTSYYLGARNTITSGSAAILKPAQNSHTLFFHCDQNISDGNGGTVPAISFLIRDASGTVYALTSRSATASANVTLERPGNGHLGYQSQVWAWVQQSDGTYTFQNEKTHLYLRVRNSGPAMGQTVTTGKTATDWTQQSAS